MDKVKNSTPRKGFSLSTFSTTRGQLFGLATLMVVIFHSYISFKALLPSTPVLAEILELIRSHFNKGVDMFLFMSGMGLYYSLSGNPNLKDFYKKRATRILPAVLIVSAIWFAYSGSNGLGDYLNNTFLITFYTEGVRNFWYFALIIFLYAIYPLVHKLFEKTGVFGMLTTVALVIATNVVLMESAPTFYGHVEIALTRIPVFLVGAWIGKHVKNGVTISNVWLIVAAAVTVGIYLFYHYKPLSESEFLYLYRYIGGIFAVAQLMLFAALFNRFSLGFVGTFLIWIGGYSMEIYLIYEKAATILFNSFHTNDPTKIAFYIAIFVVSMMGAIALKALCDNLDKNLFYRNAKKIQPKSNIALAEESSKPKAPQKEKELVHK